VESNFIKEKESRETNTSKHMILFETGDVLEGFGMIPTEERRGELNAAALQREGAYHSSMMSAKMSEGSPIKLSPSLYLWTQPMIFPHTIRCTNEQGVPEAALRDLIHVDQGSPEYKGRVQKATFPVALVNLQRNNRFPDGQT
jgi:hypothetical protein